MILKVLVVALATFCAWVVLNVGWVGILSILLNAKARTGSPSAGLMALDLPSVLFNVLFRSPWYWLAVTAIVVVAVLLARRWLLS